MSVILLFLLTPQNQSVTIEIGLTPISSGTKEAALLIFQNGEELIC